MLIYDQMVQTLLVRFEEKVVQLYLCLENQHMSHLKDWIDYFKNNDGNMLH
jgi:hypothetical protein